jgi:uncharacterized protein YndB with AHSA1/START domain
MFDAPRDLVFKAWTEPERLAQWWGPDGFVASVVEFDMRPGGMWRACLRGSDGTNLWQHGICHQIVPPALLVYSFIWDDDPAHEMIVSVQFVERGLKTEMTFSQRRFKSPEQRDSHQSGWSSSFTRLTAHLAS